MKRYIVILVSFTTAIIANAQAFDDMPYPNPDTPTFFQQEMSSLMKFQAANNINIPFFVSGGLRHATAHYSSQYLDSMFGPYKGTNGWNSYDHSKENSEYDFLLGWQIKANKSFYIPIFLQFGMKTAETIIEEVEVKTKDLDLFYGNKETIKGPGVAIFYKSSFFAGSGLFINTDVVKGGIYLGAGLGQFDNEKLDMPYKYGYLDQNIGTASISNDNFKNATFKIALVPLVPTSEWALVGKALESIFGYLGLNDVLYSPDVDKEDSKFIAYVKTINAALDLSFNKINWGSFDLKFNALYMRGKFDVVAKADTYGLKAAGLFSTFPFGFTLEGGWKHFYDVHKYFAQDYTDGGYFTGSVYFPLKKATLGFIYQYNNIFGSTYTIAMSINNFLDYFFGLNPDYAKSGQFDGFPLSFRGGFRYRHKGWNVDK